MVWVDIWDFQNNMKVKNLINRPFNIGCYIAMIRNTNMNPSILQCKNYWKWDYTTFTCYIYRVKYQKYNGPHKFKHYREMVWCCKANFKTNLPRLELKKDKLYTYSFKYINFKDKHQANSYNCPF